MEDRKVVVITGASSGIGRETALALARKGAIVVGTARRKDKLIDVMKEIEALGSTGLAVELDVRNYDQLKQLVETTVEKFGKIDVWFNNAGVYAAGKFEELPPDVFLEVMAINFGGVVNGSHAVLPLFKAQGRGTLINMSSILGDLEVEMSIAYHTSKAAITHFTRSLRNELRKESNIKICIVYPQGVDTPIYESAANYSGKELRCPPPVIPAKQAGEEIAKFIDNPKDDLYVGGSAYLIDRLKYLPDKIFPVVSKFFKGSHLTEDEKEHTPGSIFTSTTQESDISKEEKEKLK
jgi:NAD(P)-dependent dehydrogenase (short-subunit alcohol dehydrogenase family)